MHHTTAIITRWKLALDGFSKGKRVLAGISGGADSVAMLHLLHEAGFRKLIVCHLNHGLRGRAAAADAKFVEKLAAKLEFPFVGERVAVAELAKERGLSVETAAREARYEFFAREAKRRCCRTIFLAHQADDQAETFLFNLLRGTGAAGLAAMRPISKRAGLTIVRPLLGIWRAELLEWLGERRLKFREDASNADPRFTRNRLRHEIIPAIEQAFGRAVRPALWRAAELAAAENQWLEAQLGAIPAAPLKVLELRKLPLALLRRTLLNWLRAHRISALGFAEVEAVRTLLEPGASVAKINLPGDRHARRRAGSLFIE
jgi:tRNA(Ile)-lysidine synthase